MIDKINAALRNKSVAIIGVGGLGGYIADNLSRVGLGKIILMDGDVFTESNMNRQLYCDKNTLGKSKVAVTKERLVLHGDTEIVALDGYFNERTAYVLDGVDLVVDALDNVTSRLLLEKECEKRNIPFVHGAINELFGELTVVLPGDRTLSRIYANGKAPKPRPTISFVPSAIASLESGLCVKYLAGLNTHLTGGRMLLVDLLTYDFREITI